MCVSVCVHACDGARVSVCARVCITLLPEQGPTGMVMESTCLYVGVYVCVSVCVRACDGARVCVCVCVCVRECV